MVNGMNTYKISNEELKKLRILKVFLELKNYDEVINHLISFYVKRTKVNLKLE